MWSQDYALGLDTGLEKFGLGLLSLRPWSWSRILDLGLMFLVLAGCSWSWCDTSHFSLNLKFHHHKLIHTTITRHLKVETYWPNLETAKAHEDSIYKYWNCWPWPPSMSQVLGPDFGLEFHNVGHKLCGLGLKYYGFGVERFWPGLHHW